MKDVEQLDDGKLLFHSYDALKEYCDDVNNPLDKVVLGKEITALNSEDEIGNIIGLFLYSKRTNEQFSGIADWDVSNVQDMSYMFCSASDFNQPLNNWDVSNVRDMSNMFWDAERFNQPLNNWDVSKVENMSRMFFEAKNFNQPLNDWDVSNVINMRSMFDEAKSFNQPIGNWNVSRVKYMVDMFSGAESFNQDLSSWCKKITLNQSDIEKLDNGKLLFHSYKALKEYCDNANNPLDKVVLGEEITELENSKFDSTIFH